MRIFPVFSCSSVLQWSSLARCRGFSRAASASVKSRTAQDRARHFPIQPAWGKEPSTRLGRTSRRFCSRHHGAGPVSTAGYQVAPVSCLLLSRFQATGLAFPPSLRGPMSLLRRKRRETGPGLYKYTAPAAQCCFFFSPRASRFFPSPSSCTLPVTISSTS